MITAVSNFKQNSLNKNNSNNNLDNLRRTGFNKNNSSQQSVQISFKGLNGSKIGKNILDDIASNMGKKVTRFTEEMVESTKILFRKLKGQEELPFSEKPIMAPMQIKKTQWTTNSEHLLTNMKKAGLDPGTPNADTVGGLPEYEKSKLRGIIADGVKDKTITQDEADKFNSELKFCGNPNKIDLDGGDISEVNKFDDIDNLSKADLNLNDGVNDLTFTHANDLDVDGHNLNLDNAGDLNKLSLEEFNVSKLDADIDSHTLDMDFHNLDLDIDNLNLAHTDDLGIDTHKLDIDNFGLDVNPDIDLPDIDPSSLV